MTTKRTTSAKRATPWALLAVLFVGALGVYLRFESSGPLGIDTEWHALTQATPESFSYVFASFLAEIGTTLGVGACGAIVAALLFTIRQRREAGALITALVIGVVSSQLLKFVVERPRPLDALYSYSGYSYPSGHSMGAAALALSLAFAISSIRAQGDIRVSRGAVSWAWIVAFAWIFAMMWSRTALGVHWASDVVAGALVGFAAAVFAQRIWGLHRKR